MGEMKFPEVKIGELAARIDDTVLQQIGTVEAGIARKVEPVARSVEQVAGAGGTICAKELAAAAAHSGASFAIVPGQAERTPCRHRCGPVRAFDEARGASGPSTGHPAAGAKGMDTFLSDAGAQD